MTTSDASPTPAFADAAAALVQRRTGLVFHGPRRSDFEAAIHAGMQRAKVAAPEAYLARLADDERLFDELVADISVGETYLLREPEQLAVIRDRVLPGLQVDARPLRLWSAGCASGEEAYSLAILLLESGRLERAHILGTDLSRVALARARQAVYSRWSLRGVPAELTDRYFVPAADRFALRREVRAAVEFRYLNLAEDTYPSLASGVWGFDLILCRNVLIYFDAETVSRVARQFVASLSVGGWLFLGASDPLLSGLVPCEVVVTEAGLAYRRRGVSEVAERPALVPLRAVSAPLRAEAPAPVGVPEAHLMHDRAATAQPPDRIVEPGDAPPEASIELVRALANRGELAAAGSACAAALERNRTSAELHYLHAMLFAEGGWLSQAAEAARRALYLDPRLIVAHLGLATVLARSGQRRAARRALRNAARLLAELDAGAIVPAADGERAGRLAEMTRAQLDLLDEAAA